jgi:hypothetical protein
MDTLANFVPGVDQPLAGFAFCAKALTAPLTRLIGVVGLPSGTLLTRTAAPGTLANACSGY